MKTIDRKLIITKTNFNTKITLSVTYIVSAVVGAAASARQ